MLPAVTYKILKCGKMFTYNHVRLESNPKYTNDEKITDEVISFNLGRVGKCFLF